MSTRAQLLAEIAAQFPDNTTGLITPAKLRQVVEDVTNSCLVSETDAGTAGIAVLQAETQAQGRTALGLGGTIITNIDEDYVTPELTQNTKLYFSPSEDRTCDITAGAESVGTKLFLYHSGSGNYKETVTYATGKTLVLTRKMYAELERVPGGWLFVKESRIGQMNNGYIIPRGATELAGQLRDKDALWHYITEYYSSLIVTDTAWQAGDCLKFVDYSETQYRLPDWRGIFERNAGTNSKLKTSNGTKYSGGNPSNVMKDMMFGHYHGISNAEYYAVVYEPKNWSTSGNTHGTKKATITGPTNGGYGTPNVGNQTAPVSGSKYAFIYTED